MFELESLTPFAFVRASARGLIKTEPRLLAEAADPMTNIRNILYFYNSSCNYKASCFRQPFFARTLLECR